MGKQPLFNGVVNDGAICREKVASFPTSHKSRTLETGGWKVTCIHVIVSYYFEQHWHFYSNW